MEQKKASFETALLGFRRPMQLSSFPYLLVAESTRHGGCSPMPYASMNLGLYSEDTAENVQKNRDTWFGRLGIAEGQVAGMHQVHSAEVLLVNQAGQYKGYDALITQQVGLYLTVTIADCTPILLFDAANQAVAAIHAGWRGTVGHIAAKTLAAMNAAFGTKAMDCYAYIGTCIDECSFEVDADVADHFTDPFKRWDEVRQKFFIDLKACNSAVLEKAGIPASQIEQSPYSTVLHNDDYFSYRKEKGKTGRMLGVIGVSQAN
ncbi:MAG: peptidoglycan editing factor PgeF [Saprospiraceae bacterium]